MNEVQNLLNSEPVRNRLLSTMQRIARNASGLSGEFGSSAFSLAMLVFLVQEARAAGLLQQSSANPSNSDAFSTDAVREVFGNSVDDSVAGVDYSTIAETLARINDLYSQDQVVDTLSVEGGSDSEVAADGQPAELEVANTSIELIADQQLSNILHQGVQYAQLSSVTASSTTAASGAAGSAAAAASMSNFLPFLFATLGIAAVGQSSDASTGVDTKTSSGGLFDGYIKGATVFQDLNGNGILDDGEPRTTTDEFGKYELNLVQGSDAYIIAFGGFDIEDLDSDGNPKPFTGIYKAPPGSSVISPLTSMVVAFMDTGLSQEQALSTMLKILGVDGDFDLLSFDPWGAGADNESAALIKKQGQVLGAMLRTGGDSVLESAANFLLENPNADFESTLTSNLDAIFEAAGKEVPSDLLETLLAKASTYTVDVDVITGNPAGVQGLNLVKLKADGVKTIDLYVDNAPADADLRIDFADADALFKQGIGFDKDDSITLDMSEDDFGESATGSYLSGGLNSTSFGSSGLSLDGLNGLGVDVIDIDGDKDSTLSISAGFARSMADESLEFADKDTITLDVDAGDIVDTGSGSYLNVSLNESLGGTGLSLGGLSSLGVDVIDIDGSSNSGKLQISVSTAQAMGSDIVFADGDTITLDVDAGDIVDTGSGSYLNVSLNESLGDTGLSLGGLSSLGVDVIDIDGSSNSGKLLISVSTAQAMGNDIVFAEGDMISLDITASGEIEGVNGSYLTGSLNTAINQITGGLTLSEISGLGVDVIDIDGAQSATLHITSANMLEMANAGLTWADNDNIVVEATNTVARSLSLTSTDEALVNIVGDSLGLSAMGIDQVEIDEGVMVSLYQDSDFALGSDQSLKDLLQALGDSGMTSDDMAQSQDAVSAVVVSADANFAIDDTMVSALMDAGLLTANTDSSIEVETDSEHMSTSLSQLADIGADKVTTSQDKVYVDLGNVNDVDTLSQMLGNLFDGTSTLFQQNNGSVVTEVGLVLTADQADLAMAIEDSADVMAQLAHVGITELLIATADDQSVDVTLLGQEYHKVPVI